jgi:hypothetical protein
MKYYNFTIGNRSRDIPVCSAVPQPLRNRVPQSLMRTEEYSLPLISLSHGYNLNFTITLLRYGLGFQTAGFTYEN